MRLSEEQIKKVKQLLEGKRLYSVEVTKTLMVLAENDADAEEVALQFCGQEEALEAPIATRVRPDDHLGEYAESLPWMERNPDLEKFDLSCEEIIAIQGMED